MQKDACTKTPLNTPKTQHQEVSKPISSNLRRCKVDFWDAEQANRPIGEPGLGLSTYCSPAQRNTVIVSYGCRNKLPQTGRLEAVEVYVLTVVKATSRKSRFRQGCVPSKGSKGKGLLASSRLWWPQAFLGSGPHRPSLCPCLHVAFSPVSVCLKSLSLITTPVTGIESPH